MLALRDLHLLENVERVQKRSLKRRFIHEQGERHAHCTKQNLPAERFIDITYSSKTKTFETHMSRPCLTRVCNVHCHCVEFREKRENRRAHGSGSWFHTQVDGHRCNKVWCACHVEQNGIALPCVLYACEIDVLPHEIDASTKHHPLCVHLSRSSQPFSVHASRPFQYFQAIPHEVLHVLSSDSLGVLLIFSIIRHDARVPSTWIDAPAE